MRPFKFTQAADPGAAIQAISANHAAKFVAGGTNIIDLMKEGVENPSELVDISRLGSNQISSSQPVGGSVTGLTTILSIATGISIGALVKNSDTANHPLVRRDYPLITQAILSGATAQIRNMATNGGNIMQRTRCPYFYEVSVNCNKRNPGSGCSSLEGYNRSHSIFGYSDKCAAVNPSDLSVALAALDATVMVQGAGGKTRAIPFTEFHRLPGDTPERDNNLEKGELITSIEIPKSDLASHSYYLKVGDRASHSFALVSVAAAFEVSGNAIKKARIAIGGVAPKPWRAFEAEKFLSGKAPTVENFRSAADVAMKDAMPLEHNGFKVELGKRSIVLALKRAANIKA